MKVLVINKKWIEKFLSRKNVLDIRGTNTRIRGEIALSVGNTVVGFCTLASVLSPEELKELDSNHASDLSISLLATYKYANPHGWMLKNIRAVPPFVVNKPPKAVVWFDI